MKGKKKMYPFCFCLIRSLPSQSSTPPFNNNKDESRTKTIETLLRGIAGSSRRYATKSSGRLKPPFRFMYWRYFRFRITCTSPTSLPSTLRFLVVSKLQKPIVFSISISSADLPSRSASVIVGCSMRAARRRVDVVARDRDLQESNESSREANKNPRQREGERENEND